MFIGLFAALFPSGSERCEKRKFNTRAEAVRFAAKVRKGRGRGRQRPYQCVNPTCAAAGFWHLTKQPAEHITFYRDQEKKKGTR